MTPCRTIHVWTAIFLLFALQSCNYHYYKGVKLEEQRRYEEANIEYRQAYIDSPGNSKFAEAFRRTAIKTSEEFIKRYYRYLKEGKYPQAFKVLEQIGTLTPNNPMIKPEATKWFKILLAGKVELVNIRSFLSSRIPLTEEITLEVHLNAGGASRKLEAPIDYQTKIFKVEDVLYDPPPTELMSYSINSIGIKMFNSATGKKRFRKFIDFKIPLLISVHGGLGEEDSPLTSIVEFTPPDSPESGGDRKDGDYRSPSNDRIIYSLTLEEKAIKADSSSKYIDFLPRTLYVNKKDRRYFMDFGRFEISRKRSSGFWMLRRSVPGRASYMTDLQKNIILSPYFYFREGAYPFIIAGDD